MVDLYNISSSILGTGTGKIKEVATWSCQQNFQNVFYYFLLPLLVGFFLLLLLKFKDEIKLKYLLYFSKRGYVRIWIIKENKKVVSKLKKLDKFNNFKIGKRKYNLEKMYDFLIGYDEYNFPIFMYDFNFILPLKVDKQTIDKHLEQQFDLEELEDNKKGDFISQLTMKIDSSILRIVYDKKLLSDLYSISKGDADFKQKLIYGVLILFAFLVLYYTGWLERILEFVGVKI